MKARFNNELLLWSIATLQPVSVGDALLFIDAIFPEIGPLPNINEFDPLIKSWCEEGYLVRVHGKSRLYSVSNKANEKMPIRLRRYRDRVRIFLLKSAHDARLELSGDAQQELAGDSPAVSGSSSTQEGTWPITSVAVPRGTRNIGRSYWPRVVKQLNFKVGSVPRSPDTFFEYYSFPTVQSVHQASDRHAPPNDLSISDLAIAFGVSPRLLTSFTHKPSRHYRQFNIGKRGGGLRIINSPKIFLKVLQYWLLDYFLFRLPVHPNCHSYQKGRSILSNAEPHVGQAFVANIDIEDYFGSITRNMVQLLLNKSGFGDSLSNCIARLVTLADALPQGASTSPIISNAVLFDFDSSMTDYANVNSLAYTRYADDITISGPIRTSVEEAIKYAANLLGYMGLQLNTQKTRVASRGGQQKVTGVVVNTKLQPPRKLRREIRAMFHQADRNPNEFNDRVTVLRGYLNYLQSYPSLVDTIELKKYKQVIAKLRK